MRPLTFSNGDNTCAAPSTATPLFTPGRGHVRPAPRHDPLPGTDDLVDRIHLGDNGDMVAPDGYHYELSEVVITLLTRKAPRGNRRKYLRRLKQFFLFRYRQGERWDAFLTEDDQSAFLRIRAFLESIGCYCDPIGNTLDGTCDVTHPSMAYVRVALIIIRQFYTALSLTNLRGPDSPANVKGWNDTEFKDRLAYPRPVDQCPQNQRREIVRAGLGERSLPREMKGGPDVTGDDGIGHNLSPLRLW